MATVSRIWSKWRSAASVVSPILRLRPQQPQQKQQVLSASTLATAKPPSVTLYQYSICPFCHKVKALLAYAKLDHDVVEVNPLTKSEIKTWSPDYRKVPIAKIDGAKVNGSDTIVEKLLENEFVVQTLKQKWQKSDNNNNRSKMSMEEFRYSDTALRWSQFATNDLAALVYPNICRTLGDSYQAFGYVQHVETFSPVQKIAVRYLGALAMYFAASRVKAKRGISDARQALHSALVHWETEGLYEGTRLFSSGTNHPDLGDLTVFGVLRSVEGLDAHAAALSGDRAISKDWYERMKVHVYG